MLLAVPQSAQLKKKKRRTMRRHAKPMMKKMKWWYTAECLAMVGWEESVRSSAT